MSDVKWITTKSGKKITISEQIEKDNDTKEKQISDNTKKANTLNGKSNNKAKLGKLDKLNALKTEKKKEKKKKFI